LGWSTGRDRVLILDNGTGTWGLVFYGSISHES